jgi:hypothetical protein
VIIVSETVGLGAKYCTVCAELVRYGTAVLYYHIPSFYWHALQPAHLKQAGQTPTGQEHQQLMDCHR